MFLVTHPEVLADDWLPPVALGREATTREVVRRLGPPQPASPPPWMVAVVGPTGSGSSTVARRAAREVLDRLREVRGGAARLLAVRVRNLRGPHGVATALLRKMDPGFDGRGFPIAEILAGVLRRLRREGRPAVVLLDDVAVGGPELGPIVRALAAPDRFLPEGETGLPPVWAVLAGTSQGLEGALGGLGGPPALRPFVELAGYEAGVLRAIVRDRAHRSLGVAPPDALVDRILERAVAEGGGASCAVRLLRHELLGGGAAGGMGSCRSSLGVRLEPHVVHAIERAARRSTARLGEVRRWEVELARRDGRSPLPTTTLWRRIVRLERAGYVRREIRTGGPGGTLSVLRVLTPIDQWVIDPARPGTRPAVAVAHEQDPRPSLRGDWVESSSSPWPAVSP